MRCDLYAALSAVTHSHNLDDVIEPAGRSRGVHRPAGSGRAGVALAVILLPILAATVAGLVLLWPSGAKPQSPLKFAAAGVSFPSGKVTALTTGPCGNRATPAARTPPRCPRPARSPSAVRPPSPSLKARTPAMP